MVQPGKSPSPDEPFHDQNASERSDAGLEGVVEELRNVLSGLGNDAAPVAAPVEEPQPAPPEVRFPFSPANNPPVQQTPVESEIEQSPLQKAPAPSDADFWNGNVLGWADKEEPLASPLEPASVPEQQPQAEPVKTSRSTVDDLLPPLPPSPFAVEEPVAPPAETIPPFMETPVPTSIDKIIPVPDDEPATAEMAVEKPEGLIQIACIYPKGLEKQGQQFVTTLRSACEKAKLTITIQAVFIQPWVMDMIDVPAWAKAAHLAGADRLFVLASKKDQERFKNIAAEAAAIGVPSRLILLEHVGLRTLYADILVELRRP